MTCSESGESSVASANAVTQGGSGTSSGRPSKVKQDGNVPSRRHILGSKIFKEQLLEKFGNFFFKKKFLNFFFEKKYF